MSHDEPVVLTLDEETDSEEERLLASIDLSKSRISARDNNPKARSFSSPIGSVPVPVPPPSPKRRRRHSSDEETTKRRKSTAAQERKAAKALIRQQKKAQAEGIRQEKARVRQQQQDAQKEKNLATIRRAFLSAASRGTFRREEAEVVVSPQLFAEKRESKDVLNHIRALYPTQIIPMDMGLQNVVTWKSKTDHLSSSERRGSESKVSLLSLSGAHFWELVSLETLEEYAKYVLSRRKDEGLTFVIYGIEAECKKRTKQAMQPDSRKSIISMQAIQDAYTLLYMQYGIRTHACSRLEDASKYLLELTDAFTKRPYHEQDDFLDATLRYRDSRKKISNRSTVVSTRELSEIPDVDGILGLHGQETALSTPDAYNVLGEDGSVLVSYVRAESRQDLGFGYLSFLVLIPRVTIERAMAIRRRYPTLYQLFQAYSGCKSCDEQHALLADVQCEPNGRRIGPALSKTIAIVLTSRDPSTALQM